MISWMLYCIVVGALLVAAARAAEWVASLAGLPVRWTWAVAIMITFALGAVAPLRRTAVRQEAPVSSAGASVTLPLESIAEIEQRLPSSTNSYVVVAWAIASVALMVLIAGVHARVRRAGAAWPVADLHGTRVRVSPRVGPVVVGVSRPEIVVPQWLLERTADEQRLVIAHEAEHLAARDGLLLGAAYVAAALMPWNPAIWAMFSRLRLAVELDCDARVLRGGVAAESYGALLIDVAERALPFELGALAFTKSPSHLRQRIVAMRRSIPTFARLRGSIVAAFGVVALFAACEAKMPTSAEMAAMDVGAMEKSAGALGVAPMNAAYIVDGRRVPRAKALSLKPQDVVSVQFAKGGGDVEDIVEVHTVAVKRIAPPDATGDPITDVLQRSEPLIIIDGVRSTSAALKGLDRKSIANINVIKGDAVTKLYGPEALRGVIEVVTKKAP